MVVATFLKLISFITLLAITPQAQQEMSVMQNWMTVSGYPDEEPFVMIDWVSGRLRPLYVLNISYNAESGENEMGAGDGDSMFNPTMLDLVLSPQQKEACEHAMATTHEVKSIVWCVHVLAAVTAQSISSELDIIIRCLLFESVSTRYHGLIKLILGMAYRHYLNLSYWS